MKFHIAVMSLWACTSRAAAFMAPASRGSGSVHKATTTPNRETSQETRPIYDPLGLYPDTSDEKQQGRIRELEPQLEVKKLVSDPMGLYPKNSPEYLEALSQERTVISVERPIFDPMGLYSASSRERQLGLIQSMEPKQEIVKDVSDPMGLYPQDSTIFTDSLELEKESLVSQNRELYDPLGLYPVSSREYKDGTIKALEPPVNLIRPVVDPMRLYSPAQSAEEVSRDVVMSEALPFMAKPAVLLESQLAGDAGFDPLGFAKSKEDLLFLRNAELKHSRIAMLAAAGWPLSELWDKKLAALVHLKPLLVEGDRVPSLLNGGLLHVNPFYWLGVLGIASFVEAVDLVKGNNDKEASIFDPLGLYPKDAEKQLRMQLAEIKNGRLAMIAITAFAIIEAVTKEAVVNGSPFFFHPPF